MRCLHIFLLSMMLALPLALACDSKWLRVVYESACGKRKRERERADVLAGWNLPPTGRVVNRGRVHSRSDPLGRQLLRTMLGVERDLVVTVPSTTDRNYVRRISMWPAPTPPSPLSTMPPVLPPIAFSGMRQTDSVWILEDLLGDETNELYRRAVSQVLDRCCRIPPVHVCSPKDFIGICK